MIIGAGRKPENTTPGHAVKGKMISSLLESGLYEEAYVLLKGIGMRSPSASFNMALCCAYAGEYQTALSHLDNALSQLLQVSAAGVLNDAIAVKIIGKQACGESYLSPWMEEYAETFPAQARISVRRFRIDCYKNLNLWNKVLEESALLNTPGYSNVEEAVCMAKDALEQ